MPEIELSLRDMESADRGKVHVRKKLCFVIAVIEREWRLLKCIGNGSTDVSNGEDIPALATGENYLKR